MLEGNQLLVVKIINLNCKKLRRDVVLYIILKVKTNHLKPLSNISGYIVKAVKYLGYTLIALLIMILFTPLVVVVSTFILRSLWFELPVLIAISILIFRLNKVQNLIVFVSLFIFYAVIWFVRPLNKISKLTFWLYDMSNESYHNMIQLENLKVLMFFLPATIGLCYIAKNKKTQDNNISTSISSA